MKKLFTLLAFSLLATLGCAQTLVIKPYWARQNSDVADVWGGTTEDLMTNPRYQMIKVEGSENLYKCSMKLNKVYKTWKWKNSAAPAEGQDLSTQSTEWSNVYRFAVVTTDNFGTMNGNDGAAITTFCQDFKVPADGTEVTFYAMLNSDGTVRSTCDACQLNVLDVHWAPFFSIPGALGQQTSSAYLSGASEPVSTLMKLSQKKANDINNNNYIWAVDGKNSSNKSNWRVGTGVLKATLTYNTFVIGIEKATDYDLEIGSAKAATLVFPQAATIPDGVKAYTLSYAGGETVDATEITNKKIPANSPVLINAEPGNYVFHLDATADYTAVPVSGALAGVYAPTTVPQDNYVLQNHESKVGFYKVTTDNITLSPFRAYLSAPGAPAKLAILITETTGINSVKTDAERNNAIYNLAGQRVSKDYKGIVVKNGKKFIQR